MSKPPFDYKSVNLYDSSYSPSTMHIAGTASAYYFRKYLLEEAISLFDYELPDTWDRNYFLYSIYCTGYVGVLETDRYGVINQACGLYGYNIYYQPTDIIISNPLLKTTQAKIGRDCTIIKLQPNYSGIMDIINHYANMLALCAETAQVNLLNSHLSYIFTATSKNASESLKKLYDQIARGEPCVVADGALSDDDGKIPVQMLAQNVGQNYIVGDILRDMRTIRRMWLTDIGIPNSNAEKAERQIRDEVNSNNFETRCKAQLWFETLREGFEKTNEMFGTNLSIRWRPEVIKLMEGGNKNGDVIGFGAV